MKYVVHFRFDSVTRNLLLCCSMKPTIGGTLLEGFKIEGHERKDFLNRVVLALQGAYKKYPFYEVHTMTTTSMEPFKFVRVYSEVPEYDSVRIVLEEEPPIKEKENESV